MGYIRHHAIVVTWAGYIDEKEYRSDGILSSREVIKKIKDTGAAVLGPSVPAINGYRSLMVCPDGSKEGWSDSAAGDERRETIKKILREQSYDDGSSPWSWAEVQYGDNNGLTRIADHSDAESSPAEQGEGR